MKRKKTFWKRKYCENCIMKEMRQSLRIQMWNGGQLPTLCVMMPSNGLMFTVFMRRVHMMKPVLYSLHQELKCYDNFVLSSCDMHQCLYWWNPLMLVCSVTDFFVPQLDTEIHKDLIIFWKRIKAASIFVCCLATQIKPLKSLLCSWLIMSKRQNLISIWCSIIFQ